MSRKVVSREPGAVHMKHNVCQEIAEKMKKYDVEYRMVSMRELKE